MADITNLISTGLDKESTKAKDIPSEDRSVHIRVKKRNGKKCTTTIENLDVITTDPERWKELFKYFKQSLCNCNGGMDEKEKSMLLFGDHREKVKKYLIDKKLCKAEDIKVHGF